MNKGEQSPFRALQVLHLRVALKIAQICLIFSLSGVWSEMQRLAANGHLVSGDAVLPVWFTMSRRNASDQLVGADSCAALVDDSMSLADYIYIYIYIYI